MEDAHDQFLILIFFTINIRHPRLQTMSTYGRIILITLYGLLCKT